MQRRARHVSADNATPEPEQEPQPRWAAMAALRHRNFRLFWGGQVISLIGTWMQTVAQGYLVYHLTHSAVLLGVVTTLATLPVLLLTLFGGVLADRLPKRRVLPQVRLDQGDPPAVPDPTRDAPLARPLLRALRC